MFTHNPRHPKIGITLCPTQLDYLGISLDYAIQESVKYGFSHIRLPVYWSQVEVEPGIFNFDQLEQVLSFYQQVNQLVVLTVGVKAPRWPEYFWPDFVKDQNPANPDTQAQILKFIKTTIKRLKPFSCITHFQVENEPLDESGPDKQRIPVDFLYQEIKLVKKLDPRPVIVTLWGNDLTGRNFLDQIIPVCDVMGIDLYFDQFIANIMGKSIYAGPRTSLKKIHQYLAKTDKEIWLTELQAEPWEKNEQNYLSQNPGSMSVEKLASNIKKASQLPISEIILWGYEYWLYQKKLGNSRYLDFVEKIISQSAEMS